MSCYFHPDQEGVAVCGGCGVQMCRECETNAFFRLNGGKGQALCNRCSLTEAQTIVDSEKDFMTKRMIKLILCAVFIIIGAVMALYSEDLPTAFVFWFISGIISNIGLKKEEKSVKSQVDDAIFEYDHPFLSLVFNIVGNIIGYTILGPVFLISGIIGYLRTYFQYKKDLEILNKIKESIN